MISFELKPFNDVAKELAKVSYKHFEESIEPQTQGPLDIDWDYLLAAGSLGECYCVIMRDNGKFAGYALYQISGDVLYRTWIVASNISMFVEKKYRGKNSLDMLRFADEHLKKLGCKETNYLLHDPRLGKILSRLGYRPKYTLWSMTHE